MFQNFLIFAFVFCTSTIFSQSKDWVLEADIKELYAKGISYNKPCKFSEVKGVEYFENNRKLSKIIVYGRNQLHSKNKKFIVFNMIGQTVYDKKGDFYAVMVGAKPNYLSLIKNDIHISLGVKKNTAKIPLNSKNTKTIETLKEFSNRNDEQLEWKEHVNFYTPEETKNIFNSDFAASYTINLEPEDYYKGEYNNLWVLVLQAEGGGWVRMYCFYKDMRKRKLSKYKTQVESIFKFQN